MKLNAEENKKTEEEIQIENWKAEYGKVFLSLIDEEKIIWRRIKRKEYSDIMAQKHSEDIGERIYLRQLAIARAVILNIDEDELEKKMIDLAGLAITISDEVLEKSGFNITSTVEL